jgi:lipopolysaccharide export system permease protein
VNTLDRYLYRTVLLYTLMTMAVLLALAGLVLFISEQGDIGVGSYTAGDAFLFTLFNLPQSAFELLPIGAMIGALMGLGNLAAGSELVVTRASGVSVWRIAWPVGLAGLTLAVIMFGIGEYAAPSMAQFAKREKTTLKLADVSFAGTSSAWLKDGNRIQRLAGSRCSNWMAPRACVPFKEPPASRSPIPDVGACTTWRLPASRRTRSKAIRLAR